MGLFVCDVRPVCHMVQFLKHSLDKKVYYMYLELHARKNKVNMSVCMLVV